MSPNAIKERTVNAYYLEISTKSLSHCIFTFTFFLQLYCSIPYDATIQPDFQKSKALTVPLRKRQTNGSSLAPTVTRRIAEW